MWRFITWTRTGRSLLYVNELNKDALETYLINRDDDYPHLRNKFNSNDIKECISDSFFKKLKNDLFGIKQVGLICGGPPTFSGIGIRRSYSVEKERLVSNHLFQDMAYFIIKCNRNNFILENVEGLLTAKWNKNEKKGEIFKQVLEHLKI